MSRGSCSRLQLDRDWWVRCRYERAEATARYARRGMWGDATLWPAPAPQAPPSR